MAADPLTDDLKDLKKIRKRSNFEKTLFSDFFQIQEKKERVTVKKISLVEKKQ